MTVMGMVTTVVIIRIGTIMAIGIATGAIETMIAATEIMTIKRVHP